MIKSDDIVYWLALNDKKGVLPFYLLDYIVQKYNSLKTFWYLTKKEIMEMGLSSRHTDSFIDYTNTVVLAKYREMLDFIKKNEIKIIRYVDDEYPEILKISQTATHEPPILLFRKGRKLELYKTVGIVGTRQPSKYALEKTRLFSKELASMNFTIVSGMAFGVDYEAHCGALDVSRGKTIAVLPWMTPITPKTHEDLSQEIMRKGSLISEILFTPEKGNVRYRYIQRNRITSGLSNFVIAVESRARADKNSGGTMRQVDLAIAQKKQVYTLYPEQGSEASIIEGFNLLIKKGAIPIHNSSDILDLKQYETTHQKKARKIKEDPRSYKLIYGYDKDDALQKYLTRSKTTRNEENITIIEIGDQEIPGTLFTPKYFQLHNSEWEDQRPFCPRCGSNHIESRGHSWRCLECNRYFTKEQHSPESNSRVE